MVESLRNKIIYYEDRVREIRRLTVEIDSLNASLPHLEAKINELNISRGFSSFKSSDDDWLSKVRKHRQKLETK